MKNIVKLGLSLLLASLSFSASALTINAINTTAGTGTLLTNSLLAQNSGITVVGNTAYRGTNSLDVQQSGTYTGLALAPSDGQGPSLAMADGILLTTGSANVARNNSEANFGTTTHSGADASLATLYGGDVFDANVLSFNFTVAAGVKSISAQFMFGSEEYPFQSVTDIFGFFIDGVNYAVFPNGALISNEPGTSFFIDNPVDTGRFGIEYNGLTRVYTVTGLLKSNLSTHTVSIGIADTFDTSFDSGVFISSLQATSADQGGIGGEVPEPGTVILMGLGLAGVAFMRRRAQRR